MGQTKNTCRYYYQNLYDMIYSSWDIEQNKLKLVILGYFLPFIPLKIPKVIWRTVTEIWNETGKILKKMKKMPEDIILSYIHVYHKWRSYDIWCIWFLKYKVRQKFLTFWAIFCPFSPLTTWKINTLTLKKTPGDIIILHICTTNYNHMMYDSWDMECDRHNFLSFWTVFCSFTPLCILFPETCAFARAGTGTHTSSFMCAIYWMHRIIVFSLCFVIIIYFP